MKTWMIALGIVVAKNHKKNEDTHGFFDGKRYKK